MRSPWLAGSFVKIKIAFQKQSIFFMNREDIYILLNGEGFWQACDSSLSKELHGVTIMFLNSVLMKTRLDR